MSISSNTSRELADDEFEKLNEINATLAAAADRFEAVTMELKRLSKNKSS